MDEELIEFTTEDNTSVELEDIVEGEIVAEDLEQSIETESIIEVAEAEPVEEIEIEVDEAVGWTSGDNTRHYSLYGRDEPDQHPISAITGLRGELDEIGRLKTIYSDEVGLANYYKWHDGVYDDYGYFVSLVQGTNHIQICDGADIFGVTVNMAGFAGNQTAPARGNDYALVATTGLVQVRCESDVAAGDYVVCNSVGVAEKTTSGCGYKVSAVDNSTGVSYAEVSLGVQAHVTDVLKKSVQRLDDRVDEVEINVLYAMNTANTAQNMAQNAINSNGVISGQVSGALEKVESMEQQVGDLSSQVGNIESTAAQAQAVANTASTSAETARVAAEKAANESLAKVNELTKDLEPILTWEDSETGNVGATYYIEHIENGLSTKAEVETVRKLDEENKLLIEKNAESYRQMLSSVDKYSVGEYSQSYGLTYEQAVSILTEGMIYIPINNFFDCCNQHKDGPSHCETLSHIEYTLLEEEPEDWATNYISYYRYNEEKTKYEAITDETAPVFQLNTYYSGLEKNKINEFTPGYHYVWSKNESGELDWVEGIGKVVFFSTEVPVQSGDLKYWYIDSSTAPEGYEPYALYIWENEQWIKVNSLEFNRENRIVSMVQQDVNGLSVEVADARGDVVSLNTRLDTTDATVNSTVAWVKGTTTEGEKLCNIAALEQEANDDGSSFALVVGSTEGNKILEGASIVLEQDGDASYFKVDADHVDFNVGKFEIDASHIVNLEAPNIDLTGYVTFTNLSESNPTTTIINGDNITTGMLKSANYVYQDGYIYTDAGTFFKLDNGELRSRNFAIDGSGNAYFKGAITATSGYIGNSINGFTIAQNTSDLLEYVVGEDGLAPGWYYITDGQYWYSFEITTNLESGCKLGFISSDIASGCIITDANGIYASTQAVTEHTDEALVPTDAIYLSCESDATYYLANNQWSVAGDGTGNKGVYISPDGIGLGNGSFYVESDGTLFAANANISGNITTTSGYIGGWTIEKEAISANNITLYSSGSIECVSASDEIGVSKIWSLSNDGTFFANNANISGTITSTIINSSEFISSGTDTTTGVPKEVHVGHVMNSNGSYYDGTYSGELWFTGNGSVTGVIDGASYSSNNTSAGFGLGIYGNGAIRFMIGLPNSAISASTYITIDSGGVLIRKMDNDGNLVDGYVNLSKLVYQLGG